MYNGGVQFYLKVTPSVRNYDIKQVQYLTNETTQHSNNTVVSLERGKQISTMNSRNPATTR